MKILPTISLVALTAFLLLSPFAAFAAGATVTVSTDSANYAGAQALTIFGKVTPIPSATGTFVVLNVKSPTGATVLTNEAAVSASDGSYSQGFVTGGSSSWVTGTYRVNATYASGSISGSATTTFSYASQGTSGGGGISQAQFNDIMGNLTQIKNALNAIQGTQTSQGSQISSIQSSLTTLSGTVTAMQGSLSNVAGTVTSINTAVGGISSQLNSLSGPLSTAGSTQTYVLVVAVLAAITLVLELAILVRKLS